MAAAALLVKRVAVADGDHFGGEKLQRGW